MKRRLLLALAPLAALLGLSSAATANPPPFKVDFTFRFDVEFPNQAPYKNLAPWYTYFPQDPFVHAPTAPYPTWPSTWPPTGPAPAPVPIPIPKKGAMGPAGMPPFGSPAPGMLRTTWSGPASAIAPVSYSQPGPYYGAPYYWYSR